METRIDEKRSCRHTYLDCVDLTNEYQAAAGHFIADFDTTCLHVHANRVAALVAGAQSKTHAVVLDGRTLPSSPESGG